MMRRRRRATLFPYTTLFRSVCFDVKGMKPEQVVKRLLDQRIVASTTPYRDRKSTRLNSSHVSISYAVFCLQKKTLHGAPSFMVLPGLPVDPILFLVTTTAVP